MHASKKLVVCTFSLWAVGECHQAATATTLNPESTMTALSPDAAALEERAIATVIAVLPPSLIAIAQPEWQSQSAQVPDHRIASTDALSPASPATTVETDVGLQATDFPTPIWSSVQPSKPIHQTAPSPNPTRQRVIPMVRVPDLQSPPVQVAASPPRSELETDRATALASPIASVASVPVASVPVAPQPVASASVAPSTVTTPVTAATALASPSLRSPILSAQQQARAAYSESLRAWAAGIRSCLQGNIALDNGASDRSPAVCPVAKFTAVRPY
jgi:hypothetical protein